MYDIVAVGECLIDFAIMPSSGPIELKGNPGGAPANVLAAAAKLGRSTAFIGKVGGDYFGNVLRESLVKAGIDTSCLISAKEPTTLAIVSIDESGERSFSFYRDNTADIDLTEADLDRELLTNTRIFHFGSVSMTAEPARSATLQAAKLAKEAGAVISFDPNLRPMLWKSLDEAKEQIEEGLQIADLVKVNGEEACFLTGVEDPAEAGRSLMAKYGMKLLAVTLDSAGCVLFSDGKEVCHPGYKADCIDSTGAGDAFWGAALTFILENGTGALSELAKTANAAGALTTEKLGAIPALPTREDIEQRIKQ